MKSENDSLVRVREGERCSEFNRLNERATRGVVAGDPEIASTRNGGIFSLLPSPSCSVGECLMRFAVGVCSGVGGKATSHGDEASDDANGVSEGAERLPRTELRVCMMFWKHGRRRAEVQRR